MRIVLFIFIIAAAVACAGCAGTDIRSPQRWVKNNTLYSTKLPAIKVKVSTSLPYNKSWITESIAESDKGNHSGLDTEWFYFCDSTKKTQLSIDIETLNTHSDWYMEPPDYSKSPSSLSSNHKMIGEINFATGIMKKNFSGVPVLVKAYGAVAGETTRYSLLYMERVDNSWLDKHAALLTNSEQDFLSEFSKRADASFSISPYSGQPSPTQ